MVVSLLNPSKLRATVVPQNYDFVYCSAEFGVFRALLDDPYEVLISLYHPQVRDQLRPLGRGTSSSRRRITEADLLDVLVPRIPPVLHTRKAREMRDAHATLDSAARALLGALDDWDGPGQPR